MFDTPTAAYYHGPSQNAKGLFNNLSILSPLPTLPTLANLPFRYFQQPSQQDTTIHTSPIEITPQDTILSSSIENILTSNDLSTTTQTAPTAPQQPAHTNRRTQRRTTQKQQQNSVSATVAATAPQRTNSNMGTAQSSRANLIATSSHHYHATNRRKKYSNKINRKKVDEAITLSAFAVEEDNQGNHDVAIEFYLNAIENMLEALPIHANQSRKDALKNKLRDFMDREGLTDGFMESTNASSAAKAVEREEELKSKCNSSNSSRPAISNHIIQAAINSAVALKQSPIPDAISATVNYTMKKIRNIDEAYGLQNKAWEISRSGINMALEIDQQYNVHEKVGNAFFIGLAAAMKAGIAYKDSPSYREIRKMRTEFQNAGTSNSSNINNDIMASSS